MKVQASGSITAPKRQLLKRPTTVRQQIATRPLKRVLLTRKTTHAENIGLSGDAATQARVLFACWRYLSRDFTPEFITSVTGLSVEFVREMAGRFSGD